MERKGVENMNFSTLDFLPGLKTALGGVILLVSILAPGLISDAEAKAVTEAVMQIAGGVLVVLGVIMKVVRWYKKR